MFPILLFQSCPPGYGCAETGVCKIPATSCHLINPTTSCCMSNDPPMEHEEEG